MSSYIEMFRKQMQILFLMETSCSDCMNYLILCKVYHLFGMRKDYYWSCFYCCKKESKLSFENKINKLMASFN